MSGTPLDDVQVSLVDSVPEAERFLRWLSERRPTPLAVDTETTGLKWWTPSFLRTVQFGDGEQGWTVPVHLWRGVAQQALAHLADDRTPTLFLNCKFDLHALEADGLPLPHLPAVTDVGTMHRLANPLGVHSLKGIASRLVSQQAVAGQSLLSTEMSRNGWDWATVPVDLPSYWTYAALDTVLTARIYTALSGPSLPSGCHPFPQSALDREMAVQMILYRAERRGMRVDADYTADLLTRWTAEADDLRVQLQAEGIENPNSNRQVAEVLKAAGWEPEEFTETGQARLDHAVLGDLSTIYGDVAPVLLRYKRLVKWCSSYLSTFLQERDPQGYVHASINTSAARTGRMSITNPALQTLPRGAEIRDCVIPDPDHSLYAVDYDTMEMRVFAHYAADPALRDAASSEDIHGTCASLIYGDDYTPTHRQTSKAVNFARVYGAGAAKISHTAGVSEAEVRNYLTSFDSRFPGGAEFIRAVTQQGKVRAAETGEAFITTHGGRRIPAPDDGLYRLTNYLIQGSCADIFKDALIRLDAAGLADYIIVPVHDEVVFQFPDGDAGTGDGTTGEQLAREACSIMETDDLSVPLTCGLDGPLTRWGDKYRA